MHFLDEKADLAQIGATPKDVELTVEPDEKFRLTPDELERQHLTLTALPERGKQTDDARPDPRRLQRPAAASWSGIRNALLVFPAKIHDFDWIGPVFLRRFDGDVGEARQVWRIVSHQTRLTTRLRSSKAFKTMLTTTSLRSAMVSATNFFI